ncbi:ABC-2 family transporter protein [Nonomuraea monospora]|uniref:ABC-2 family transporter protein n=1 Tax=Nonomuraea monospora TaxID=568818 RepID=A0ABN3CG79_9ACTN
MRATLRVLRRLLGVNLGLAMAYRGEFAFYVLGGLATPVVSLLIWRAALRSGARLPVDETYLTTYFVLMGVVQMLTSSWLAPYLAASIRRGELSVWLVRPVPSPLDGIANNLVEKLLKLCWQAPAIALLWWLLDVRLPDARWALVAVSVALAAILVYAVDHLIGSLAFWFDDVGGLISANALLARVLSGGVVPLALMPEWTSALPYRFMLSFPLEIAMGAPALAAGLALQVAYTAIAVLGARAVWRAGLRAYAAVGA